MATPQELARRELARRELERRRRENEGTSPSVPLPASQPDYRAMAQKAFGPELDDGIGMDTAFAKMRVTPTPEQVRQIPERAASATGVYAAGSSIVESGVGLAKMYVENFKSAQNRMYESLDIPKPKTAESQVKALDQWVQKWDKNLELYKKQHPEDFVQLESEGFTGVTKELFSNPMKMVKSAVQSLPLMLEGLLPGGVAVMATASAGQHYRQNRQEGDSPEKAALRAWVTAVPEAAIERFTLNKKINLFRNMKSLIQGGTRKVMWEFGKAYLRGAGEEGSQTFNENLWRWVFSDRSTDVWQGVKEAAAVGGPLEAMFSGVSMAAGSARTQMVDTAEKIKRVNKIRDMVTSGMDGDAKIQEVNAAMDEVITNIEAGKYDQPLTDTQVEGTEYGLTPEQTDQVMQYAEQRFQQLDEQRKKTFEQKADAQAEGTSSKKRKRKLKDWTLENQEEWKFLRDHREDFQALIEESTNPDSPVNYADPQTGKPAKHSRPQYKNMVMNMVQKLEDQDVAKGIPVAEARDGAHSLLKEAIKQVTGKDRRLRSLKGDQLEQVAAYMSDFATDGVIDEGDWDNYVIIDGKRQKMRDVMNEAYATSERAPIVEPPKKSTFMARLKKRVKGAKNFLVGIHNTPLYSIAKRLDGGSEDGVFSQVLDKNIQAGHRVEAGFNRQVYEEIRDAFTKVGITEQDLVKMSTDLDPIRSVLRVVTEHMPTQLSGTQDRQTMSLGNRDADLTWAELIDLYLISGQKDGHRHLLEGGLVIDGQDTGPLTPTQLANARAVVESNEKVKRAADLIKNVSNSRWRPVVNATSQSLDGRKIANIPDWWGLEVLQPGEVGGEKKEFNVNLIENKSIFHTRTHSSRPLVLRDAFRRFSAFQGSIANYYGMAEPFRIARTLLNDKAIWDNYRERGKQDVFDTAQQLLKYAQGTVHAKNVLESIIDTIMPNTYRALLYYNPRVWMSQYTSVVNYGSYVSPKYLKNAFGSLTHVADNKLWDEMLSSSDVAYERFHTSKATLELGVAGESDAIRRNLLGKASWGNKASWMLKAADMAALLAGWDTAKAEFKDAKVGSMEGKSNAWWAGEDVMAVEEGSPEYQDVIRRRSEYLWQRTQPSWDIYNRSMITNAPKLVRSFLMFRSFHEKVLTIWNDAATELESSDKSMADVARFADRVSWPIASYMTNALMRVLVGYMVFGKREKIGEVIKDTVLSPLDAFPVLGTFLQDALGALYKGLADEQVYLNNENLESMPLGMLNDLSKGAAQVAHGVGLMASDNDPDGKEAKKALFNIMERVAIMNGIPSYQIKGIAKRFIGQDESENDNKQGVKVYE